MTRILFCWEDRFHMALDVALRRAVRHVVGAKPETLAYDRISVRGHGGFQSFIGNDWPLAHTKGFGLTAEGGTIDHVICIADADSVDRCSDFREPV